MKRARLAVVIASCFVAISTAGVFTQSPQDGRSAVIVVYRPGVSFDNLRGDYRPDTREADQAAWAYLDRGVVAKTQALERALGFRASHVYSSTIHGFAADVTPRQRADLQSDPAVAYIEPDGVMNIVQKTVPPAAQTLPWGIDRLDADTSSTVAGNGSGSVANVRVYVIDTGIDTGHKDLFGIQTVNFAGGQPTDCNGHGTHVAGTIAARDNTQDVVGVAPGAPVVGVKVLGCSGSGTTSGVIKGIDWVGANAVKPAIANMSLGGGASTALDTAVLSAVSQGVFFSIAAGNDGADACTQSPARVGGANQGVMTVAATNSADQEASWSNYGTCVDVWAPGVNVTSLKKGGGTITYSGTSMASPHVGATAALYLSSHTSASPADVEQALRNSSISTGTVGKGSFAIRLVYAGAY